MYRIALQLTAATTNKPATFQFLTTGGGVEPWESADEKEGLAKFCSELDNYKRSLLTLVDVVPVKCHCEDENNVDQIVEFDANTLKVVVNDGTNFVAKLDLSNSALADYTSVAVDNAVVETVVNTFTALGFADVKITKEGITATNPTGVAIENSVYMNEGIWRLYSESDRKDNFISSALSFNITSTVVVEEPTDEPEAPVTDSTDTPVVTPTEPSTDENPAEGSTGEDSTEGSTDESSEESSEDAE